MLNPKKDRLDYGEQLIPPQGYELDFAIGTTYSLNLETLMVLPVALYHSQTFEAAQNEISMLDYIANSAKKVLVFCQKGKISVPKKFHYLFAYWENSVQEITLNHYAQSFHPKVWVIKYKSEGSQPIYRLMITSRNLTFASDWDVAFSTDGIVTDKEVKRNTPLIEFLRYLERKSNIKLPHRFTDELRSVEFEIPKDFHLLNFHPIGIPNPGTSSDYLNPLNNKKWDELLAISPFLDTDTIRRIASTSYKQLYLLSVKEELDSIKEEVLKSTKPFQFSSFIQNAEFSQELSEEGETTFTQGLHAKLFVGKRNDYSYWYLGSANLTAPAFGRNVEFMIELKTRYYEQRPSKVLKELTREDERGIMIFEPYDPQFKVDKEKERQIELDIREIVFKVSQLLVRGHINKITDTNNYNLIISIQASKLKPKQGYQIRLKLLSASEKTSELIPGRINEISDFNNLTETQLTPYIHWEVYKDGEVVKQFLTKMKIQLPKSRLGKILSAIIDSREKFLKYITYLLLGDEASFLVSESEYQEINERANSTVLTKYTIPGIPIYENMLIAASRTPQKLKSIDELIRHLKKEDTESSKKILTPEFENFWKVFRGLVPNEKRRT